MLLLLLLLKLVFIIYLFIIYLWGCSGTESTITAAMYWPILPTLRDRG
jgi:hypothetical protein